jgi:hypothetical protein
MLKRRSGVVQKPECFLTPQRNLSKSEVGVVAAEVSLSPLKKTRTRYQIRPILRSLLEGPPRKKQKKPENQAKSNQPVSLHWLTIILTFPQEMPGNLGVSGLHFRLPTLQSLALHN